MCGRLDMAVDTDTRRERKCSTKSVSGLEPVHIFNDSQAFWRRRVLPHFDEECTIQAVRGEGW